MVGVWIGQRCIKFVRADEVTNPSMLIRNGYKRRGPYFVKVLNG